MSFPYESREAEPAAVTVEACIVSGEDMKARLTELREQFAPGVLSVDRIENGSVYWFERSEEWLTRLCEFVSFESQCCPHLDFGIGLQAGGHLISLRISSEKGAAEFTAVEPVPARGCC